MSNFDEQFEKMRPDWIELIANRHNDMKLLLSEYFPTHVYDSSLLTFQHDKSKYDYTYMTDGLVIKKTLNFSIKHGEVGIWKKLYISYNGNIIVNMDDIDPIIGEVYPFPDPDLFE